MVSITNRFHGAPIGSIISVVALDMYMEHLDNEAMDSVPQDTRPSMWKQYINESFEVVKRDKQDELTEHLNPTDTTGIRKIISGCVDLLQGRWKSESAGILKGQSHQPVPEPHLLLPTQPYAVYHTPCTTIVITLSQGKWNQQKRSLM